EGRFKARSPAYARPIYRCSSAGNCRCLGRERGGFGERRRLWNLCVVSFTHGACDYLRLGAGSDCPMLLVSAVAEPALFPAHRPASQGRPSRGDADAPPAETSGVLSVLVGLVRICSATVTNACARLRAIARSVFHQPPRNRRLATYNPSAAAFD